jgi:hypothetical protein
MRFLNYFRRAQKSNPASTNRPRTFRPQLEQLDERLVPSTISSAISSVHFGVTEHNWYTTDRATNQVVEFTGTSRLASPSRHNLFGPYNVFAVSASLDPKTGYAEVFALSSAPIQRAAEGRLWLCDSNGTWHNFGGSYVDISATRDGHVYAVNVYARVSYLDSNGNATDVGAPSYGVQYYGIGSAVAASTGWFGQNEVFAIGMDGVLYVNSGNAPGQWQMVDNHHLFTSLSATVNDTVFALSDGSEGQRTVYQETEHIISFGWFAGFYWTSQQISPPSEDCWFISAGTDASGYDEVYVVDSNTDLYLANRYGSWTQIDRDVCDIAGADHGYYYDVNYNSGSFSAFLWNPEVHSGAWDYLGNNLN